MVEFPAASPAGAIKQRFGLTDVEIVYFPSRREKAARSSAAFVPYGKVVAHGGEQRQPITFRHAGENQCGGNTRRNLALFTIPGEKRVDDHNQ